MGLSYSGSWPIHTPFATSAITEQPTEQWVQTFLRVVTVAPGGGGGPACAFRTPPSGRLPSAASAPAATPERFRKLRRSRAPLVSPDGASAALPRFPGLPWFP